MTRLLLALLLLTPASAAAQNQSTRVSWLSFPEALAEAPQKDKKVLVDIFAPWCGWCTKMQNEAYMTDDVVDYLKANFVSTRLDISIDSDTLHYNDLALPSAHLAAGFGAEGTPTTVFLAANGEYITRLPGYAKPEEFLTVLKFIASDSYKSVSFEAFSKTVK